MYKVTDNAITAYRLIYRLVCKKVQGGHKLEYLGNSLNLENSVFPGKPQKKV